MQSNTFRNWQLGMVKAAGAELALIKQVAKADKLLPAVVEAEKMLPAVRKGAQGADNIGDLLVGLGLLGATGYATSKTLSRSGGDGAADAIAEQIADAPGAEGSGWSAGDVLNMLMQPGVGTAVRGAGGAGAGYLLGKYLGDHGTLGATLGGVAGLTPEIIKYSPELLAAAKSLFKG